MESEGERERKRKSNYCNDVFSHQKIVLHGDNPGVLRAHCDTFITKIPLGAAH